MAKGKEKGNAAPHQVPPHPAVNDPKNHPAANVPPATQDFDGAIRQIMANYGPSVRDSDNDGM